MGRITSPGRARGGDSPLSKHIGGRLLALRQRDLLTMRAVARKAGLSDAFVCQVENGQSVPSAETLWKLARCFGVSIDFFFEGYVAEPEKRNP